MDFENMVDTSAEVWQQQQGGKCFEPISSFIYVLTCQLKRVIDNRKWRANNFL